MQLESLDINLNRLTSYLSLYPSPPPDSMKPLVSLAGIILTEAVGRAHRRIAPLAGILLQPRRMIRPPHQPLRRRNDKKRGQRQSRNATARACGPPIVVPAGPWYGKYCAHVHVHTHPPRPRGRQDMARGEFNLEEHHASRTRPHSLLTQPETDSSSGKVGWRDRWDDQVTDGSLMAGHAPAEEIGRRDGNVSIADVCKSVESTQSLPSADRCGDGSAKGTSAFDTRLFSS